MTSTEPATNYLPEAVLFAFDDNYATAYTAGYPILEAAGLSATMYVRQDGVGQAGSMTEAEIVALDAAGWDIANHTANHTNLTELSEADQEDELTGCADYLDGLGLTRASHFVAYPYGAYNADTLTAMANTEMLTGRTTGSANVTVPISTPLVMNGTCLLSPTRSLALAKSYLSTTAPGRILTYYGHGIDDSGTGNTWTPADFAALVAYVKASGVRVVTISQVWDYIQAGYTW